MHPLNHVPTENRFNLEGPHSYNISPDGLTVTFLSTRSLWSIQVLEGGLIHVHLANGADIFDQHVLPLLGGGPPAQKLSVATTKRVWTVASKNIQVIVSRAGEIHVRKDDQLVFSLDKWKRAGTSVFTHIHLDPSDHIYGLGEKTGSLDKRGEFHTQWTTDIYPHTPATDALYQAIPMAVLASPMRARGVFLANTFRSYFDSQQPNFMAVGADDGPLSLYLCSGPELPDVLRQYTALTGRTGLPPRWALGFQQSRYSYMSQDDVLGIAKEFRQREIPLDVIYLDIDYMDGYRVFTWDPKTFSQPHELTDTLKTMGVKAVPIIDPGVKVENGYSVFDDGQAQKAFITYKNSTPFQSHVWPGLCQFPDFLRSDVRKWWGHLNQSLKQQGVAGIWNDMNEPALWGDSLRHPSPSGLDSEDGVVHHTDQGEVLPHSGIHNVYALFEAMATHQGLQGDNPSDPNRPRPFVVSRSGFSGIQQYAAVWTGDNSSWWEHLATAIPMCLNLGLSGVPFIGTDIGGFLGAPSPELYARWIQAGVFFPFVRSHTDKNSPAQEPWVFGEEVESIARRYIGYRYRLLPYLESLFEESARTGSPIMRPLLWIAPHDSTAHGVDDQFLVGNFLMIAPVTRPKARQRLVYLPQGHWNDVWTGEPFTGPCHIVASAPLHDIPIFVRSGSIIPLGPSIMSTQSLDTAWQDGTDGPEGFLITRGYGEFVTYSDDGQTFAYQTGQSRRVKVTVRTDTKVTHIRITAEEWSPNVPPLSRTYRVWVGYFSDPPRAVNVHGEAVAWEWDDDTGKISLTLPDTLTPTRPITIHIEE